MRALSLGVQPAYRIVALMTALALTLGILAGCAGRPSPTVMDKALLDRIPSGMSVLTSVRVGSVVNDPELRGMFDALAQLGNPEWEGAQDVLAGVEQQTGVEPANITEALFAVPQETVAQGAELGAQSGLTGAPPTGATTANPRAVGALAFFQGTFDRNTVVSDIDENTQSSAVPGTYEGEMIYRVTFDNMAGDASLAFLANNVFVLGTEHWVKAALDVKKGKTAPLSGAVRDELAKLGSPLIKAHAGSAALQATGVTSPSTGSAPGGTTGTGVTAAGQPQGFSLTIDKLGQIVEFEATQHYADAAAAIAAATGLRQQLASLQGITQDQLAASALSRVVVTVDGTKVIASASLTLAELRQALATAVPGTPTAP